MPEPQKDLKKDSRTPPSTGNSAKNNGRSGVNPAEGTLPPRPVSGKAVAPKAAAPKAQASVKPPAVKPNLLDTDLTPAKPAPAKKPEAADAAAKQAAREKSASIQKITVAPAVEAALRKLVAEEAKTQKPGQWAVKLMLELKRLDEHAEFRGNQNAASLFSYFMNPLCRADPNSTAVLREFAADIVRSTGIFSAFSLSSTARAQAKAAAFLRPMVEELEKHVAKTPVGVVNKFRSLAEIEKRLESKTPAIRQSALKELDGALALELRKVQTNRDANQKADVGKQVTKVLKAAMESDAFINDSEGKKGRISRYQNAAQSFSKRGAPVTIDTGSGQKKK